jgi:hypothetical protein
MTPMTISTRLKKTKELLVMAIRGGLPKTMAKPA